MSKEEEARKAYYDSKIANNLEGMERDLERIKEIDILLGVTHAKKKRAKGG